MAGPDAAAHGWRQRPRCGLNDTQLSEEIAALPAFFLRHWASRSVSFRDSQRTYLRLAGWGRTRFQIVDGELYYPNLKHNTFGCVLRRTPILAFALLETLSRHPTLPDVDIPVNCRDKPGSHLGSGSGAELAFSYTTARGFSDVPLPDYTYWGLPYADLPPWPAWLAKMEAEPDFGWRAKREQMIWVGSPTNPIRSAFAQCAPNVFGDKLVHRMPQKETMHELAWRCKPQAEGKPCPTKPPHWTSLEEQCRYRYILHLPGISDWLEHFKHQLACGSVNIFLGTRPLRLPSEARAAGAPLAEPPAFEHFDLSGPLLREGEHFVYVPLARGANVCGQLQAAMAALEAAPRRARCLAKSGQALSRTLNLDAAYDYTAAVLRGASAAQHADVARRVVRAEGSRRVTKRNFFRFVPPAKRPWMEHIFMPWHRDRFNETRLLPPRGDEDAPGLFH